MFSRLAATGKFSVWFSCFPKSLEHRSRSRGTAKAAQVGGKSRGRRKCKTPNSGILKTELPAKATFFERRQTKYVSFEGCVVFRFRQNTRGNHRFWVTGIEDLRATLWQLSWGRTRAWDVPFAICQVCSCVSDYLRKMINM